MSANKVTMVGGPCAGHVMMVDAERTSVRLVNMTCSPRMQFDGHMDHMHCTYTLHRIVDMAGATQYVGLYDPHAVEPIGELLDTYAMYHELIKKYPGLVGG